MIDDDDLGAGADFIQITNKQPVYYRRKVIGYYQIIDENIEVFDEDGVRIPFACGAFRKPEHARQWLLNRWAMFI